MDENPESRRDQEEGGELDSHEEASPEEIKSREVVLDYRERESLISFASVVSQRRSYGHCLFDCSAQQLGQQLRGAVVAAQCRTDTAVTFCCSGGGPRQPWFSVLAPVSRFHSSVPFSHSSPSLKGFLAYVDKYKQQQIPESRTVTFSH